MTVVAQKKITATAIADSSGNATFDFGICPNGLARTGTVACPTAPSGSGFTPFIGTSAGQGIALSQWGGPTSFGPVQARDGEVFSVVATGLTANGTFQMVWTIAESPSASTPVAWPAALTGASSISGGQITVQGLGPGNAVLAVPPDPSGAQAPGTVTVGNTSTTILAPLTGANRRIWWQIANPGTVDVWLALGQAAVLNRGMWLPAGGIVIAGTDDWPTGSVTGITASSQAVAVEDVRA